MHEIIFKGGLGNQLFCLFQAYKISIKYNAKVFINLANYSFSKREDRKFLINKLYPPLYEEFQESSKNFSKIIFLTSRVLEKCFVLQSDERLPGDKSFSINYFPNRYLHSGYFQKIYNSNLDKEALELIRKKFYPYISKKKNRNLAIHIRRGDYLSKDHSIHGIINEKFLINESKKQLLKKEFKGITIFSDSPELIDLRRFRELHKNICIDPGGSAIKVFKRMANHKGLVASNSTFSLWAGILGGINNFSIPYFWMKNVKSSLIGLEDIYRYKCEL